MVLTSLKTVSESTSMNPFIFFPKVLQWENYKTVIQQNDFIRLYFNTFVMMILRVLCAVVFSAMAAYAFARLDFPGKNILFGLVLFQMMVPAQIFVIPQYLMVDKMGMKNTVFALVFPGLVSAFGTFLMRQFLWDCQRNWKSLQDWMDAISGRHSGNYVSAYKVRISCTWNFYGTVFV